MGIEIGEAGKARRIGGQVRGNWCLVYQADYLFCIRCAVLIDMW